MDKRAVLFLVILFFYSLALISPYSYYSSSNIGVDDASIFLVYAKNFLSAEGFVWNKGEMPVEGFTSFLWQVVCIFSLFFFDAPESFLTFSSLAILTLASTYLILAVYKLLDIEEDVRKKTIVTISFFLAIFASPGFLTWNLVSLMDTCLWTSLLMLASASLIFSKTNLFIIFVSIAPLVRPEGLFVAALAVFILFYKERLSKSFFIKTVVLFLPVSVLTIFRLLYFSYPFPNTYYAKVGANKLQQITNGGQYFVSYLQESPLSILFIFSCIFFVLKFFLKSEKKLSLLFFSLVYISGMGVYVYLGGDHFPLHRQYQGFYLLGFVGFVYMLSNKQVLLLAICFLAFLNTAFLQPLDKDMQFEYLLSRWGREAGRKLNNTFVVAPRVSAIAVGGIAYTYHGPLIDLMGITNAKMAHATKERVGEKNHAAFDIKTFYEISPDLVSHFGPSCLLRKGFQNDEFINKVLKNLPSDEVFRERYRLFRIPQPYKSDLPGGICGFIKREYVPRVQQGSNLRVYEWS